ncbi:MAG: hypothetical protein GX409_10680, partial [candidate division Zixibacteria bacterium]|nr:hypothetical protein [candidate division Zixibacteria bacterium]
MMIVDIVIAQYNPGYPMPNGPTSSKAIGTLIAVPTVDTSIGGRVLPAPL